MQAKQRKKTKIKIKFKNIFIIITSINRQKIQEQ